MIGQTPEQNLENIKAIYEILGREFPDESRTILNGVRLIIELSDSLKVKIEEDVLPVDRMASIDDHVVITMGEPGVYPKAYGGHVKTELI